MSDINDAFGEFFNDFFTSKSPTRTPKKKTAALDVLHHHDELNDGEFDASSTLGGGWKCIGSWHTGDVNSGACAVGLMVLARNASEFLILIRNSNPHMPQLWVR
jgi:hypothetical protein